MSRYLMILIVLIFSFSTVMAEKIDNSDVYSQHDDNYENITSPADTGFDYSVLTLKTIGTDLIVGGKFFSAGGVTSGRIAGWDGSAWYAMPGLPFGPEVYSIIEFNNEIMVASFLDRLYKWTDPGWSQVGPDLSFDFSYGRIEAMEIYNNELYIGGNFRFDTLQPPYIAKWNGIGWDSLGYSELVGRVYDLMLYNGELVAGGTFSVTSVTGGLRIASWDGSNWSAIGTGITASLVGNPVVHAMVEYNDWLVAAGYFIEAGGNDATNIARWNGSYWQKFTGFLNNTVYDVIVYDNFLIAAGAFNNSGSKSADYVAYFDGADWVSLGNMDGIVYDLEIYNGVLVAGGDFLTAGGGRVAWWDTTTTTWRPMSDLEPTSCCVGIRGNVDNLGGEPGIDISDLLYLVDYMFLPPGAAPAPPCIEEANIDGELTLDIADLLHLVDYMFQPPGAAPEPAGCL